MDQITTDKQAYLNATPMQREVVRRLLCDVLGCLRAQYLSYQTSHWLVKGGTFYGNHLLFQRLYESVQGQIDQLAEKITGYLGSEAVSINYQMRHISDYTYSWSAIDCNHKRGLQSEADLQQALKRAYDGIKQAQAMSLGLDDWIMATANAHEENEYLLQQTLVPVPGEGKQAARQPRSRKDLIGYFVALHDELEKEFNYSADQVRGMDRHDLEKRVRDLQDSLSRTPDADDSIPRALKNAPAAYRHLERMSGGKLASYDRYPSIGVPRGWRPSEKDSEGCTEEYMEEVGEDFTKTCETFIKRAIRPTLKKRGWGVESHGVTEPLYEEDGATVEVEVWGRAGQKIGLGGRKYIVLDRDVTEVIEISMLPEMADETFEGSEQFDVDEFAEWSWDAECPTDDIRALEYSGSEFSPTPKGVEDLLTAFDRDWIRSNRVRSKIKKKSSGAPSAEGDFYKAPNQRAVLEFAKSNAISNDVAVAEKASEEDHLDIPEAVAVAEAKEAPPLPTEIVEEPGGKAVSTLNQYVIKSEDPVAEQAVKMNEARMAAWRKELD
jgi:DNA-binding ferritin-like protein